MKLAIIALLVTLEIVVNFLLIREAGDMASVAGSAALYSFVNVIIPYWLLSEWIRYAWHVDRRMAIGGWLGILFFVVFALFVNLMMAHYRGVVIDMTSQMENVGALDVGSITAFLNNQVTAFSNFLDDPFGLKDTFSVLLCMFGCALSIGGVMSGLRADDRYPGYGELDRRYDDLFSTYIDAVENTVSMLRDKRDDGSEGINNARKTLEKEFRKIPNMVATANAMQSRCSIALERLDTDYNLLVKEYRQANQKSRSSKVPEYFDRPVSLGQHDLVPFESPAIEKPAKAVETLQRFSDKLHDMFDSIIGSLESTRQVLEDGYPFEVKS